MHGRSTKQRRSAMRRREHALRRAAAARYDAYLRTPEGRALLSEAIGAFAVSGRAAMYLLDADGPRNVP
jgi:hypothetical protein